MSWLIWPIGLILIVAAGFAATYLPRRRALDAARRNAWVVAHAAIESATISRDASSASVVEADRLLGRAELIAAHRGGRRAAREATGYAEQADILWRRGVTGG